MDPITLALAKKYTDLKVEQAGSNVQADWNQNDASAPDYIKNRIAWEESKKLGEIELKSSNELVSIGSFEQEVILEKDKKYTIELDSGTYTSICKTVNGYISAGNYEDVPYFGNLSLLSPQYANTGEPYLALYIGEAMTGQVIWNVQVIDSNKGTKCAIYVGEGIHKIDPKFYERLAWVEGNTGEILPETQLEFSEGMCGLNQLLGLMSGASYVVTYDGRDYALKATMYTENDIEAVILGEFPEIEDNIEQVKIPFLIADIPHLGGTSIAVFDETEAITHTFKIIGNGKVHKVDPIFLPEGIGVEEECVNLANFKLTQRDNEDAPPEFTTIWTNIFSMNSHFKNDTIYKLILDDQVYYCEGKNAPEMQMSAIGNQYLLSKIFDMPFANTGEDFVIMAISNGESNTLSPICISTVEHSRVQLFEGGKITEIDPKFLPKGIGYKEIETIHVEQDMKTAQTEVIQTSWGNFIKLSDDIVDFKDIKKLGISVLAGNTQQQVYYPSFYLLELESNEYFSVYFHAGLAGSTTSPSLVLVRKSTEELTPGIYGMFEHNDLEGFQTGFNSVIYTKERTHKIDSKYLPDTVATKADIFGAMEASY